MGGELVLIRHGETAWNQQKRLQGRADVPLTAATRAALARRRLPPRFRGAAWFASPLSRAVETARLLGADRLVIEPRLIEMDFGAWEGHRLAELRAGGAREMAANEARGLDLCPPGGETPRRVQDRLRPWLAERAAAGGVSGAVSHKGVIRAVLAMAYDWDMLDRPPVRLDWRAAHTFAIGGDGTIRAKDLNIELAVT